MTTRLTLTAAVLLALIVPWQVAMSRSAAAESPSVSVAPGLVVPGSTVQAGGSGFGPSSSGASVRVCIDQIDACQDVDLTPAGSFSTSLYVGPTVAPGAYTVSAQVSGSAEAPAQAALTVTPPIVTAPATAPKIVASPNPVSAGGQLSVTGTGWPDGAEVRVCLVVTSFVTACVLTNVSGDSIQTALVVPPGTLPGPLSIRAYLEGMTYPAVATQIAIGGTSSALSVFPSPALPGSTLTLVASGLVPGDGPAFATVTSQATGQQAISGSAAVQTDGSAVISLPLPEGVPGGDYTVQLTQAGRPAGTTTVRVSGNDQIGVLSQPIAPGSTASVRGNGFSPGSAITASSEVLLTDGTSRLVSVPATVGTDGSFAAGLPLPDTVAPGIYAVRVAADGGSLTLGATQMAVQDSPQIDLLPATQAPGGSAVVVTTGFLSGEPVQVSYSYTTPAGSASQQATGIAGVGGTVNLTLSVPPSVPSGSYTITALGQASGRQASAQLTVSTSPIIALNPTVGDGGTTVAITGAGFPAGAGMSVGASIPFPSAGTQKVMGSGPAVSAAGGLSSLLVIPRGASTGNATFSAPADASSADGATAQFTVLGQEPSLEMSPFQAAPGDSVRLALSGFAPGSTNHVTILATIQTISGSLTDQFNVAPSANGDVSTMLSLPNDAAPGLVTISATQLGSGVEVLRTLQVVPAGPPPPTPTSTALPATPVKPAPASTPTPIPPPTLRPLPTSTATSTSSPTPRPTAKPAALRFKTLAVWFPVAKVGTFNHVDVQGVPFRRLTIQATVTFPNGARLDFHGSTDGKGHWGKTFPIERKALAQGSNVARISVELKRGKQQVGRSLSFTLVK